jgi:cyclic pyranopterin phosphate synthase
MPEDGVAFAPRSDILGAGDILAVARAARSVGVDHFKLTGGEPTVRADLLDIVEALAGLEPTDLSMTTNGMMLDRLAGDLRRAGLDRLTISCDSLQPDRFARITGYRGKLTLDTFWRGIDAAEAAGFERLKLNVVVIGGINDDEVVDFAAMSLKHPWTIRFIEYMPLGDCKLLERGLDVAEGYTVDSDEVMASIEAQLGPLTAVGNGGGNGSAKRREPGVGPAKVYQLADAPGRVGFISAMSRPFCETCNRLRLTADGDLRACLFDGGEVSVLPALRGEKIDPQWIVDLMRACVAEKPRTHSARGNRAMSQLGG